MPAAWQIFGQQRLEGVELLIWYTGILGAMLPSSGILSQTRPALPPACLDMVGNRVAALLVPLQGGTCTLGPFWKSGSGLAPVPAPAPQPSKTTGNIVSRGI